MSLVNDEQHWKNCGIKTSDRRLPETVDASQRTAVINSGVQGDRKSSEDRSFILIPSQPVAYNDTRVG